MPDLPESVVRYLAEARDREREQREKDREASLQRIERANKIMFNRECAYFGADPAKGVSPSLVRVVLASQTGRRVSDAALREYYKRKRDSGPKAPD